MNFNIVIHNQKSIILYGIENSFLIESSILLEQLYMSGLVGKPTMWFPTTSDTNRAVQAQKRATGQPHYNAIFGVQSNRPCYK